MAIDYVPAKTPLAGDVFSILLQFVTFGVLCICLTRRTQVIKKWGALPLASWLVLIIYIDSTLFVLATGIMVHGFGINTSSKICEGGILLCLVCYMTTKILIYYFLVERAYIVRGSIKPRLKTKLWLFNCLFMLLPYTVFVIMNFIFRITYINKEGVCIIGMQKIAMLPLITFEVIVNVYLTLLFVIPLRSLYSYKHNQNPALNRMAFRSFVGSCATLTTSVINLTILMVLKGEPGWICLMACNADILFCVLVLHWVSSKEQKEEASAARSGQGTRATVGSHVHSRRVSTTLVNSKALESGGVGINGDEGKKNVGALSTVVTECKSDIVGRNKGKSGLHRGDVQVHDDEVELNNIRVQTIQTREVEVDSEMGRSGSMGTSGSRDDWEGSQKRVVGERMV